MHLDVGSFWLKCVSTDAEGKWDLLAGADSWHRVRLRWPIDVVVVFEYDDRRYSVAAPFPAGVKRQDLDPSIRDASFITLYGAPDESEPQLSVSAGTAFGEVDERFDPYRLAVSVGFTMLSVTPGEDLVPLSEVRHALGAGHDVFISHAHDDLADVAAPLKAALQRQRKAAWLNEIEPGESIRQAIDEGLRTSRAGVVILSQAFFSSGWTNYELDGLLEQAIAGRQLLLLVWHGVAHDDVLAYSPSLANRLALSTAQMDIDSIALAIAKRLGNAHRLL